MLGRRRKTRPEITVTDGEMALALLVVSCLDPDDYVDPTTKALIYKMRSQSRAVVADLRAQVDATAAHLAHNPFSVLLKR